MRSVEDVKSTVGDRFLVRQAGDNFALELKGNPSASDIDQAKAYIEGIAKENGLRAGTTQKTVVTFWLNQPSVSTAAAVNQLAALKAELEEMKAALAAATAPKVVQTQTKGKASAQAPF